MREGVCEGKQQRRQQREAAEAGRDRQQLWQGEQQQGVPHQSSFFLALLALQPQGEQ